MLEWHNAAAEIAMEVDPERPQIIWRDYQYQGGELHIFKSFAIEEEIGGNHFSCLS